MGRFLRFFEALLFPPHCRNCGARQNIFDSREPLPLCRKCKTQWDAATQTLCSVCGETIANCRCIVPLLRSAGCAGQIRLAPYNPGNYGVVERLIFHCKEKRDMELFHFLGEMLQASLQPLLQKDARVIVTWVPRRKIAVQQTGHDQAKEMAIAAAQAFGVPARELLCRKRLGGEKKAQKTLTMAERIEAAEKSFRVAKGEKTDGATVILIDDVCTTGASLAACCELLLGAGVAKVICASVAGTVMKKAEEPIE